MQGQQNIKTHNNFNQLHGKGKMIPLQARCGPEGGQR